MDTGNNNFSTEATIAMVDDEEDKFLDFTAKTIILEKYKPLFTKEPSRALKWIKNDIIDMVVSDHNLNRDVTGLDFLEEVRKISSNIPLVLYTYGAISNSERIRCKELNIHFLDKKEGNEPLYKNIIRIANNHVIEPMKDGLGDTLTHLPNESISNANYSDLIKYLKEEIVASLDKIEDKTSVLYMPLAPPLTVENLIAEVKTDSDIGKKYLLYWVKVKNRLKKLNLL